jgi:predicted phosphoadenosine phosphosulfate sulfurtransferase
MFETHWRPWEESKRALWARAMPQECLTHKDFNFITENMSDYAFQKEFSGWYHKQQNAEKTCVLIGIRAEESLDRWRTIVSDRNINKFENTPWTTKTFENVYNAYPIYDWKTEDIWTAYAKFGWNYNKLYDLFHYAGVPLHSMRVASPFHDAAKSSLSLYRVIDPNVWGKMVSRVNGVNFTALYGGTKAMGWKNISKPEHLSWKQYAMFLLDTLPQDIAENYRTKLETSIKFWKEKGGVLSEEAISDLKDAGIDFEVGETTNYKTDKLPVRMEYIDDIESKDFTLIPTWKRLCVTILKNDHVGKYMGFSQTKKEIEKRKAAMAKYKDL